LPSSSRRIRSVAVLVRVVDDEHVERLPGEPAFHSDGDEPADVPGDREPGNRRGVPA
jgi:hypothetical protein